MFETKQKLRLIVRWGGKKGAAKKYVGRIPGEKEADTRAGEKLRSLIFNRKKE